MEFHEHFKKSKILNEKNAEKANCLNYKMQKYTKFVVQKNSTFSYM